MLLHADKYSSAFSKEPVKARDPKYNKVSFADYEAGKVKASDMWLYSSFWYKDFDGMGLKTMLRQIISKWGIMSIELQTAMERDESLQYEDGTYEYVDNVTDEPTTIDITPEPPQEEPPAEELESDDPGPVDGDSAAYDALFGDTQG